MKEHQRNVTYFNSHIYVIAMETFLTNFSLHHRVQTGSGVHPAPYPMGTEGVYPKDKATGT
jgi:hypothetical protein